MVFPCTKRCIPLTEEFDTLRPGYLLQELQEVSPGSTLTTAGEKMGCSVLPPSEGTR